jgi:phosphoribosylanthranilate isomerase
MHTILMPTLVKICGITRLEDALFAAQVGADFLGYIFYAPSKRFIPPRSAAEIIRSVRLDYPNVRHIGVFVDDEQENVAWVRNLAGLDYVQLHGDESAEYCRNLAMLGIDTIKVVAIGPTGAHLDGDPYQATYYMCDTYDEKMKGGTGRQFDLALLPDGLPMDRTFIAGGLTPENVSTLLAEISPYAVDVSTGVEDKPGIKCHERVKQFISNVQAATSARIQEGSI